MKKKKTNSPGYGSRSPHVVAALKYARGVTAGRIPACKWVVLACQRHLDDLARSRTDAEWPYTFSAKEAERWCSFMEKMPHVKGVWARDRERITLQPWQCFKTVVLFGWVHRVTGLRRFKRAVIFEPRKNAKSTWAAMVGLGMLTIDGEEGAEIYSGATSRDQADFVFQPARLMALAMPKFREEFGVAVNASNINVIRSSSRFEALIGKPGDGASPSCAIHDEYHEHPTDEQVDAMATGMAARSQPLQIIITTAGDNLAGPCYQAMLDLQKILQGLVTDDRIFGIIYTVDPDDDWESDKALAKANPNLGVSVTREYLQGQRDEAKRSPRKQGAFKTKHLNLWVQSRAAFFNTQAWIDNGKPISLLDFIGQPCTMGMDLASKKDIAELQQLFDLRRCRCPVADMLRDEGFLYAAFGTHWIPEARLELTELEHYRAWHKENWLQVTEGNMIDMALIEEEITRRASVFQVEHLAFDPHQATQMVTGLMKTGLNCVEYRPTVLNFSEPMKLLDGHIVSLQIAHDADPVMTWMISNVVAQADAKDNVYPRKETEANKIDGPVALISALGVTLTQQPKIDMSTVIMQRGGFA